MKPVRDAKPISWIKAVRKDFEAFPDDVRSDMFVALTLAAEGAHARDAKPMKGLGGGVFEIASRYRGDAFRLIYALGYGADVWVVHAFQKKSKSGIATPRMEISVLLERLKRLREFTA